MTQPEFCKQFRTCSRCKVLKPFAGFSKCAANSFGLQNSCKACQSAAYKADYVKNREKYIRNATERNRKAKYGVTPERYNEIINAQDSKCAICEINLDGKSFSLIGQLDHCHKTGVVRGILCGKCNTALGSFQDDIKILKAAILYLENSQ